MSSLEEVTGGSRAVYLLLRQDKYWFDVRGQRHNIAEMSVRYKRNVIGFLERRAKSLATLYGFGEIAIIYGTLVPTVVPDADGNPVEGPEVPLYVPSGEMAQDALEQAMDAEDDQRMANPVAWIRGTKLVARLIDDIEHDRGGTDGDEGHQAWLARQAPGGSLVDEDHDRYEPGDTTSIDADCGAPEWTRS